MGKQSRRRLRRGKDPWKGSEEFNEEEILEDDPSKPPERVMIENLSRAPIAEETMNMCSRLRKIRFKDQTIAKRLSECLDRLETNAQPPRHVVTYQTIAALWRLLECARNEVDISHQELARQKQLDLAIANKLTHNAKRREALLKEVEHCDRRLLTLQHDATAFNCAVTLCSSTTMWRLIQKAQETEFVTNSRGERVLKPPEEEMTFEELLREERKQEEEEGTSPKPAEAPPGAVFEELLKAEQEVRERMTREQKVGERIIVGDGIDLGEIKKSQVPFIDTVD